MLDLRTRLGRLARFLPNRGRLDVTFIRKEPGWLASHLPEPALRPGKPARFKQIEAVAAATNRMGSMPLWEGYRALENYPRDTGGSRSSDEVRSDAAMGCFYAWLAERRRPDIIVEFGAAFGISGMYWLAGLDAAGHGELLSFEPNDAWAGIAEASMARISSRYCLTLGTFEDEVERVIGSRRIDIAFIDAIHTSEFVLGQLDIVLRHARQGALVLLDDIEFSDDMRQCWRTVATGPNIVASAKIGTRLGIVETRSGLETPSPISS